MNRVLTKLPLLLVLGVAPVGLAACGSDSASSTTTAPAKKNAGAFAKDVKLTVANNGPNPINVKICSEDCRNVDLNKGDSTVESGDRVDGDMRVMTAENAGGSRDVSNLVYFQADNPAVGRPWISVDESNNLDYLNLTKYRFSQGDNPVDTQVGGNGFLLQRDDNTDVINLKMTVR